MSRMYCQNCKKPQSVCICGWLIPQASKVAVFILQHPDEVNKAIGTARIIELGLLRSKIHSSIELSKDDLKAALNDMSVSKPVLIYPQALSDSGSHHVYDFEKERFTALPLHNDYDSIILLDGTWRNTRELLHRNVWLRSLPTLALENAGESRYRIRQAKQVSALATIEAVSMALTIMDSEFQADKLLLPFEKMIETQIEKMGLAVFEKNYLSKR